MGNSTTTNDPYFRDLKKRLAAKEVEKVGGNEEGYKTKIWKFLKSATDKGGPFRLIERDGDKDEEEVKIVEKFISMNQVKVDVAGQ